MPDQRSMSSKRFRERIVPQVIVETRSKRPPKPELVIVREERIPLAGRVAGRLTLRDGKVERA